ncbi:MFS general substrate transporter [Pleurostoma richardsiae]|uniref:MFS general substrate transporter n=1 Tax=Pleurostoma richardsiae TaxID=41990 RepID=A0AA38RDQ0_9PEZI|nr:MFS general substrate transporter [Pleurostoma richardsiae]
MPSNTEAPVERTESNLAVQQAEPVAGTSGMVEADAPAPAARPEATRRTDPPPNGGSVAWLQVSAAFALYWNTLGLLNGFGAFQTYYQEVLLSDMSASAIAWIGSIQIFFLMTGGLVIGPLYDLGFVRSLLIVGTILVTFGFMMTSISTQYYQVLLAQGVCVGLGTSCLYMPAITLVPAYFSTRRARAMGVAAVGSSLGATIYPLVFERLQPQIGFGWTVRVIAFITLAMCCYAIAVARPRATPKNRRGQDKSGFSSLRELATTAQLLDKRYIIQCVAIFFSNVGFFEPLYYLQTYAQSHGMQSDELAKYLLVILNAVAIPGRILPSYVADRVGVLDTYIGISTLTAASVFYWISVTNRAGNIAFSVLYGFFSGSIVTLAPVVLASITSDLSILGTRLGVVAVLKGIGSLIGPPIAGAILGATDSYLGVQLFSGLALIMTALLASVLRVVITRSRVVAEKDDSETGGRAGGVSEKKT